MAYAIETIGLTKRYPSAKGYRDLVRRPFGRRYVTALEDVSIQVKRGEFFGLLGPNGAGKTTLIKILCNLVLPTEGKAFVNGCDVSRDGKKVRREIGYVVSEERSFYWRLTGKQNLLFFTKLNNLYGAEAKRRTDRILALMDLEGEADKRFKDYSTGIRQRLAIARALIINPEILLMDEPTKSLDPSAARHLKDFISETIVGEMRKTILFATHNLNEAAELADRIAIIDKAHVKARGTLEEIRKDLKRGYTYRIRCDAGVDNILDGIRSLGGVLHAEYRSGVRDGDGIELEVELRDRDGLISEIVERIVRSGGRVRECVHEELSLNEIFSRITGGRE